MGRIGWQISFWKLSGAAVIFASIIVGLRFVYMKLLGEPKVWWWPASDDKVLPFLIGNFIGTSVMLIVCVYGGRIWVTDRMK